MQLSRTARVVCLLLSLIVAAAHSAPAEANQAPVISGTPRTEVNVNWWYSWAPTVSDSDDATRTLRFSIANKPDWALFSIYSGKIEGQPTEPGTWSDIRITVSDGEARDTLPAFAIRAVGAGSDDDDDEHDGDDDDSGNRAPTISGSPTLETAPGVSYSFTPSARDANGDKLTFSVSNRPAWASFDAATGRLHGTPSAAQVGAYNSVRISVSDGRGGSAALPSFSIAVTEEADGAASLSWTPPTRNTNGSALTNLAGYRVYYGASASALTRTVQITNPSVSSYVISNLTPATWYFAVRAYNGAGVESTLSNTASKVVR